MSALAENKYVALLRDNPDYRRLYSGQIVSLLGDWFEFIAVQTLVFSLTNSGFATGLAIIASNLPAFFLIPIAGSIADRFDRRKIMIAMDLVRACLALSLLLVRTADQIWMVYVFQTLSVVFSSFFNPALNAAIPNLVRREELLTANALSSATWGTMLAVGTFIGGVAVGTVGRDMAFVLNSLSFLGSAFFVSRIRTAMNQRRVTTRKGLNPFADFVEGFRYAAQRPQVFWLLIVKSGGGLAGGVILLLTVFSFEVFHTGAEGVGFLQFARGLGILVGPFIVARFVNGRIGRAQRFIALGFLVVGISYVLFGLAPTILLAMICVFFAHTGWGSNWTLSAALLQRLTPDHIRGRIFSMDLGMLTLTLAFSTFVTGVATDRYSPHSVAYALGAIFLLFGIFWAAGVWLSKQRAPSKWQDGLISAALAQQHDEVM
jgi:MFS family permease